MRKWIAGSTLKVRVSHGQFPPGGTFDSSQRVSLALSFKHLQSTGGSWLKTPRSRKNGVQASNLLPVDGTVFPEPPMEEGLAHFRSERS